MALPKLFNIFNSDGGGFVVVNMRPRLNVF